MRRSEWLKIKPAKPGPVLIDIHGTPMARVASQAAVIAATAESLSPSDAQIKIYRYDPEDAKPYNVDAYSVWEDLPSRHDFSEIVSAASTDCDDNMRAFLAENVFIVSRGVGSSHWLEEGQLPITVRLILPPAGSSGAG